MNENSYRPDDIISIKCIDDGISRSVGLWAGEIEQSKDTNFANHHAGTTASTTNMLMEFTHIHILHREIQSTKLIGRARKLQAI